MPSAASAPPTSVLAWYKGVQTNDFFLCPVLLLVFLGAVQGVQIRSISPGQKWPGFSFALHLLRVPGFYFALLQYSHTQAFTAYLMLSMQFIQPAPQNSAQNFTGAFPVICRVLLLLCGRASGYAAQPARRWRAYRQAQCLRQYQIPAPRRTLYRSAQQPYYNKVYKSAAYRKPCQRRRGQLLPFVDHWQVLHPAHPLRGQRLHLYGVSPAACNLAPVISQGAAGGAEPLTATAVSLFRLSPDSQ